MKLLALCLVSLFVLGLCGCSTTYNVAKQEEEVIFINYEKEIKIGEKVSRQVKKRFEFSKDKELEKRVTAIGKKIADVCERKDVYFQFFVLDEEKFNAFALPGGFVYINSGVLEKIKSDDELAAIISHEVAHIVQRHGIKKLEGSIGYSALRILTMNVPKDPLARRKADLAFASLLLSYSREDEIEADAMSVRYLKDAGYDPVAALNMLKILWDKHMKGPIKPKIRLRSHPYLSERIAAIKKEIYGRRDFVDYINIVE